MSPCCKCRSFLRSLDPRNISNGAAEILKMACIKDEALFDVLDNHAEELRSSSFQVCLASPPSVLLLVTDRCSEQYPHMHAVQPGCDSDGYGSFQRVWMASFH